MWQWARSYARECEADDSGAYVGLLDKVRERLGDFRPAPGEARPWHEETTLEERIALAAKEKQGLRRREEEADQHSGAGGKSRINHQLAARSRGDRR
jgi:hypothetical protein